MLKNLKITRYFLIVLVAYRTYTTEYLTLELLFKIKPWGVGEVAQTMYTHVSIKCKNKKIKNKYDKIK
jgi:hypothetical protein